MKRTDEADKRFADLQKLIIAYFKGESTQTMLKFIDSFVYHQSCNDADVSALIDRFLKDNGLVDSYCAYVKHINGEDAHEYFTSISSSELRIIEQIKTAFFNLAYHRLHDQNEDYEKLSVINKKSFNEIKTELLGLFACLNRSENYFYGEQEDAEKVAYYKSLNYE